MRLLAGGEARPERPRPAWEYVAVIGAATSRPLQGASTLGSAGFFAAVLLAGGCTEAGPPPEEQRDVVVKTAQALVDATSTSMNTDAVDVTDDGTTARECPEGGARYTYAAMIGPASWEDRAHSPAEALSGVDTGMLGRVARMQSDPALDFFPDFDEETWAKPTAPEDPRSTTYSATRGDAEGISLTYVIDLNPDDEVVAEITAHTRCG